MTGNGSIDSIHITVKVFGGLREALKGGAHLQQLPPASSLTILLQQLQVKHPVLHGKLVKGLAAGYLNVLINGRNIQFLQGNDTLLHDGDIVAFLPPVGGG